MTATARGTYAHRPERPAQGWEQQAACHKHPRLDPETWTSDESARPESALGQAQAAAQAVCVTECPVRPACLQWALDTEQEYGVWGGLLASERTKLLRRQRRAENRPVVTA